MGWQLLVERAMTSVPEPAKVLSLGSIVGGQTQANKPWVDAIRQLTRDIAIRRGEVLADINVNVEFHIPGDLLTPDFEGVRTGTFRKADNLLKVQVALPPIAPADARSTVLGIISEALDAVDQWAMTRRRAVHLDPLRALVRALAEADG